ncbi:putative bifunctional diguanylate cyclase/phosphodiesterase [Mesobacterium pallidum]|uniref:putative bifunctional diguanylate cyclase/phosphodiesterase n=1 Tax=Mesobacterium pallidum TaxID=2872037 RepID=UPI001EE2475B|nr:GGDEF domain-containing phosphodiesterase [Mesobacterium pallidum]
MARRRTTSLSAFRSRLRLALSGPHLLAFIPAVSLGSFWLGGEGALTLVALFLPVLFLFVGGVDTRLKSRFTATDPYTLLPRDAFEQMLESKLQQAAQRGRRVACLLVRIDDFDELTVRFGPNAADTVLRRAGERMVDNLREIDSVRRLDDDLFGIIMGPVKQFDMNSAADISSRLQTRLEDPFSVESTKIYLSCSIGYCISTRDPDETAPGLFDHASTALTEAQAAGNGCARGFTREMGMQAVERQVFGKQVRAALEEETFTPWFQPQISTDTGEITGFEALARWVHPERGVVGPADFLPVVEELGALERLGEMMLTQALQALAAWDRAGLDIPTVSVNFAGPELRNPRLIDRIKWELDRVDIPPERLVIEVLETVVTTSDDERTVKNVNALAEMGCHIDLDDFGTGNASISALRRFSVSRLKIDRSFVKNADKDLEQRRIITAILTMAERLGLDTLAEGVETAGEHAILSQLGCGHVQGFGIARPMSLERTFDWITTHNASLAQAPRIGGQAS